MPPIVDKATVNPRAFVLSAILEKSSIPKQAHP